MRFFVSGSRASDARLSRLYFSFGALHWGALTSDENHLASFRAGLAECADATRILDLGTGAGASAALLADSFPDAEIVGVDLSRRMLATARRSHARPNLSFRCGSVADLRFPDASFDLVTLHNAAPDMFELRRVLKPSGQVLQASTFSPLRERTRSVAGRWEDFGMSVVAQADVGEGAYQLFVLSADAGPPPLF